MMQLKYLDNKIGFSGTMILYQDIEQKKKLRSHLRKREVR